MHTPFHLLRVLLIAALALVPASLLAQHTHGTQPANGGVQDHDVDHPHMNPQRMISGGRLNFTENRGQIIDDAGHLRPDLLYVMRSKGVFIYLAKDRIYYAYRQVSDRLRAFYHNDGNPEPGKYAGDTPDGYPNPDSVLVATSRVAMEFVGANPDVKIEAEDPLREYTNYYLGHCRQGILGVPGYRKVIYRGIYPNIDLVVHATDNGTKYDFVVHPGGRVSDIRIRYNDADRITLEERGVVRVTNALGYLVEGAPESYQAIAAGGGQAPVRSRYVLRDGIVTFDVGRYDVTRDLVIDPTQEWSTLYGGTGTEDLVGGDPTEVDRSGNSFIVGYSLSINFPTTPLARQPGHNPTPGNDAFVVKFDPYGNVVFATYHGGDGDDIAHGVTADPDGNVFVAGHTTSSTLTFPLLNAYQATYQGGTRDGFVAKFNPNGGLMWSTFSGTTFWDDGYAFAVDSANNAAYLLTTRGDSLTGLPAGQFVNYKGKRDIVNHPTGGTAPRNEQILIKYNGASGNIIWAKFFGGNNDEIGYSAASDINNNILVTGWTLSNDFPVTPGCAQAFRAGNADCFLMKMDSAGTTKWATYYGGPNYEDDAAGFGGSGLAVGSCGMATDYDGNIFLTGTTTAGFPTVSAWKPTLIGGRDAFVVKFDTGGAVRWATYLGTTSNDYGMGCASNAQGSVLVTGYTTGGTNLPTTGAGQDPAFQPTYNGGTNDAFLVKLDRNGNPKWVTYFGGSLDDQGF